MSAAVSAREARRPDRVLILEKDVMIGGHSIMSSGYFNAVDPKRQKPLGIIDSPALMEKQSLQVGGDTASHILMRRLAESSSEVLQWAPKRTACTGATKFLNPIHLFSAEVTYQALCGPDTTM